MESKMRRILLFQVRVFEPQNRRLCAYFWNDYNKPLELDWSSCGCSATSPTNPPKTPAVDKSVQACICTALTGAHFWKLKLAFTNKDGRFMRPLINRDAASCHESQSCIYRTICLVSVSWCCRICLMHVASNLLPILQLWHPPTPSPPTESPSCRCVSFRVIISCYLLRGMNNKAIIWNSCRQHLVRDYLDSPRLGAKRDLARPLPLSPLPSLAQI